MYKKWKKNKTTENRDNFEKLRSDANIQAKEKRCSYYQNSIKSSSGSQKELLNVFNHLLDNNKKSQLPFSENHHILANRFNNYFVQKIENIRNNLDIPVVDINPVMNDILNSTFNSFKMGYEFLLSKVECR